MGLRKVLLKHYARYPKMDIQDVVKLIYQNEFAGGHLIKNEKASLEFLQGEFASLGEKGYLDKSLSREPIFVDIGNSLGRLHLQPLKKVPLSQETVNKFFVNTANSNSGTVAGFQAKLEIFKGCCQKGFLPFPLVKVEEYLKSYEEAGYPAMSHSEEYRNNYCPAYRIVKTEFRNFLEIFTRIDSLIKQETVTIAIDGNSGAGKSSLANLIADVYDCNLFHMDDFFLTPDLKTKERLQEVGGNVDYQRFKEEVITGIQSGQEFQYQAYDCQKRSLGAKVLVQPKRINIIEGSYSMHPTLRDNYHLKIFMAISEEEQSKRIFKRNGPLIHKIFLEKWIPLENTYFREMKIKDKCDVVYSVS